MGILANQDDIEWESDIIRMDSLEAVDRLGDQKKQEQTKGENMKNILWTSSAGSAAVLLGLIMTQGIAQEKGEKPSFVIAETNVVKATVEDINHAKREVTLKDQEGNKVKLKVSDEVENLEKVKKGDQVVAGYYQSAAIAVKKPGETDTEEPARDQSVMVARKGEKPGGIAVKTTQVTATVEDINYPKREVKLKDPDGNTVKFTVGDRVKNLDEVKKGDQIVARYTEALAVSMTKPEE